MSIKDFQKLSNKYGYTAKLVTPNYFKHAGFTGKALSIEKNSKYVCLMPLQRISNSKGVVAKGTPKMQFTEDPEPSKQEENLINTFADENIK